MAIPTVTVTAQIDLQNGDPAVGARIIARLDRDDKYNGIIVKRRVIAETDETGLATLELFPNELGDNGSQYDITVITQESTFVKKAYVPNSDCDLHDVMDLPPGPSVSVAEAAKRDALAASVTAQASAAAAAVSAGSASTNSTIAQASAVSAQAAQILAEHAKDDAETAQAATESARDTTLAAIAALGDILVFSGTLDCSTDPNYPAADAGAVYIASAAGHIGGASGKVVEAFDAIVCIVDASATGDEAAVGANWVVLQKNIDGQVTGPTSATDENVAVFNGTTGKIVKDGGYTVAQLLAASISKALGTAAGDLIVFTASGVPAALPVGAEGQGLVITGGVPAWGQVAASGDGSGGAQYIYERYGDF